MSIGCHPSGTALVPRFPVVRGCWITCMQPLRLVPEGDVGSYEEMPRPIEACKRSGRASMILRRNILNETNW